MAWKSNGPFDHIKPADRDKAVIIIIYMEAEVWREGPLLTQIPVFYFISFVQTIFIYWTIAAFMSYRSFHN